MRPETCWQYHCNIRGSLFGSNPIHIRLMTRWIVRTDARLQATCALEQIRDVRRQDRMYRTGKSPAYCTSAGHNKLETKTSRANTSLQLAGVVAPSTTVGVDSGARCYPAADRLIRLFRQGRSMSAPNAAKVFSVLSSIDRNHGIRVCPRKWAAKESDGLPSILRGIVTRLLSAAAGGVANLVIRFTWAVGSPAEKGEGSKKNVTRPRVGLVSVCG